MKYENRGQSQSDRKNNSDPSGNPEAAISVTGLEYTITDRKGRTLEILKNINLQIADGEFVSIVGPSGCGKSTLLNFILNKYETGASAPTRAYPDLHDHLRALEEAGLVLRIDVPINKDTEMHPLMRWQFCGGMDENDRKAMLFTNVVDSKGKKYDMPVLIGAMAASPRIFEIGIGQPPDKMIDAWARAMGNLVPPRLVESGPCQEVVIEGDALNKPGCALDALPVPISTPGWDNAPYLLTSP